MSKGQMMRLNWMVVYAKDKEKQHDRIKSNDVKHVIKSLYHIQNVNRSHSRMKQWLDRLRSSYKAY